MMDILIVKMSSLGDLIHTFPVLEYLKQNIPEVRIDWVVEQPFAELIRAHPFVNKVHTVQTKKWRSHLLERETWKEMAQFKRDLRQKNYALVFDLQGNTKSACVTASALSPLKVGFGYETVPEWPNILTTHNRYNPPQGVNIRNDYLFIAQSAFAKFTEVKAEGIRLRLSQLEQDQLDAIQARLELFEGMRIMVCPGSNWPNKQLADETLRSFLQHLTAKWKAHLLFVWGNKGEREMTEQLKLSFPGQSTVLEKVSLPLLQNLMSSVDLVLAMDSLPLHLAGTTSTPTYSFFGPSSSYKYKPAGEQHVSFQGSCPYRESFNKRCAKLRSCKTGACMKALEGKQLFDHFVREWEQIGKRYDYGKRSE